jgi:hypothetical protein
MGRTSSHRLLYHIESFASDGAAPRELAPESATSSSRRVNRSPSPVSVYRGDVSTQTTKV